MENSRNTELLRGYLWLGVVSKTHISMVYFQPELSSPFWGTRVGSSALPCPSYRTVSVSLLHSKYPKSHNFTQQNSALL